MYTGPEVDINAADWQGYTALHHLVCPLDLGTYDNTDILGRLVSKGADVNKKDKAGDTPLDLALKNGAWELADQIQTLMKVTNASKLKPSLVSSVFEDHISWNGNTPDCNTDAEAMLKKIQDEATDLDDIPDPLNVPDSLLKMNDIAEVVQDTTQNVPYSVLMTKVDVSHGEFGIYNFYKMQILWQRGKDLYILFNRWGRIGDEGNYQQTPFQTKDEVVKEFCKIFRSKTHNDWIKLDEFENHHGKYRLVQAEERKRCRKLNDVEFNFKSELPCKLSEPVQQFLKYLTDVTAMNAAMEKTGIDTQVMPFGQIKKTALEKAAEILNKLKELINQVDKLQEEFSEDKTKLTEYHAALHKICELTNEYYHIMPQKGYEYERVQPFESEDEIEEKLSDIYAMIELEYANKLMAAAQYRISEVNPMEYIYRCLNCYMEPMGEDDQMTQYLLKWVYNSSEHSKIEAVFRVCRKGEDDLMKKLGMGNHKLLFHGSSTANLLSILGQGLLINPTHAVRTGFMFGKGIYTADVFEKSAGYCYTYSRHSSTKFMLVCEVALGSSTEVANTRTFHEVDEKGCDSIKALGNDVPNEQYDVTLPTGATISVGNVERKYDWFGRLAHNEYIVYNEDQVCLRYIIQFQ